MTILKASPMTMSDFNRARFFNVQVSQIKEVPAL